MIDDWLKKNGAKAVKGVVGAVAGLLDRYFSNFRWVEFSASVAAAYGAMKGLGAASVIPVPASHTAGLVAAGIAAVTFIRSPKTKWDMTGAQAGEN